MSLLGRYSECGTNRYMLTNSGIPGTAKLYLYKYNYSLAWVMLYGFFEYYKLIQGPNGAIVSVRL